MQKPDRHEPSAWIPSTEGPKLQNGFTSLFSQERWIWWVLELSHARLGGGAAGMMAAMTAGA